MRFFYCQFLQFLFFISTKEQGDKMKAIYLGLMIMIAFSFLPAADILSVELPTADTLTLTPYAQFDFAEINESSALIKSRQWDDVYWTLNDSGGENKIYPISRDGKIYRAGWFKENDGGVRIGDAVNIDWESMTTDNDGNLYVSDCGNNNSIRRDLCVYVLKDPFPEATGTTRYYQKINLYYPEQNAFPAPENDRNYDSEAIFCAQERLFILTKHRSDTCTRLYTVNSMYPERLNAMTLLSTFDIKGMVTDAACSKDGTRLAVLTYDGVWLFTGEVEHWFSGSIKWLPISAKQCEAISFDDEDTLLITNEQTEIFELKISELIDIR
jgi:hypothetical protein